MSKEAFIVAHKKELPLHRGFITEYSWEGPRTGIAYVDLLSFDNVAKSLPFPIKRVGPDNFDRCSVPVMRCDNGYWVLSAFNDCKLMLKSWLSMLKRRIIMTLMVWNMADVPFCEAPAWEHIKKVGRKP